MNRRKKVGRFLGRGILRIVIVVVRLLPLSTGLALGSRLGDLMRLVSKRRYGVALKNLDIAYGDSLEHAEKVRIARESFRSFGMFAVESIKFGYLSKAEVSKRVIANTEFICEMKRIQALGTGAMAISGHLGNFEVGGKWFTDQGFELVALARETRDRGITSIMTDIRTRLGITVVNINQTLKPVLQAIKRNACVAIICDQNAADVFVPFFGRLTGTVAGPAKLALRTGAPLVFFACYRKGWGTYEIEMFGTYEATVTCDIDADVRTIMTEVNRCLEVMIRRHPEQWLWFHDRWKSSPQVSDAGAA